MTTQLVRVTKTKIRNKPTEMVEVAVTIVDGKVTEWQQISDHTDTDYSCETVEPIATEYGPEKCGYGPLLLSGGVVKFHYFGQSHSTYLKAEDAGSEWRNYGAPHGTRKIVKLNWVLHYPKP